ncbi:hypothetical protein [Streptomyces californicus]|uniref:hypothetical protein n=1 Tax=Streptomyces californicus TaxID=67351 RepID=UPI0033C909A8
MEDAAAAELRVNDPLDRFSPVDLQGRDLAEDLHHAEFPGLVRFLLLHGASWSEAQDAAQDAFTQMCRPGTSSRLLIGIRPRMPWNSASKNGV